MHNFSLDFLAVIIVFAVQQRSHVVVDIWDAILLNTVM